MASSRLLLFAVQLLVLVAVVAGTRWQDFLRLPSESASASDDDDAAAVGTRWAVLIAGSNGYYNYRHQADVCHAYQIMKKGGLKDENIVVLMYDDIADSPDNPRPGVIINRPDGGDVYAGVPKDYTGEDVNVNNFLAVLLGNKSAVTGKVVASGPDDHVFVYYSDHGGPGVLGMPSDDYLYAKDLVDALERKHAAGGTGAWCSTWRRASPGASSRASCRRTSPCTPPRRRTRRRAAGAPTAPATTRRPRRPSSTPAWATSTASPGWRTATRTTAAPSR